MRRKRRSTQHGEFEDPLKDYSPPEFEDKMERALCEDRVDSLEVRPFLTIDAQATVQQALTLMHEKNIACVMVTRDDRLVGIFSERDVLNKVADNYEAVKDRSIQEVMVKDPLTVYETDSPAKALNLMAIGGFRHVPILNLEDKVVGVLGPRRVSTYLYKHFV